MSIINSDKLNNIYNFFPLNINKLLIESRNKNKELEQELQEIRVRAERPIILKTRNEEFIINYNVSEYEILQIVEKLCNSSIYAYKDQICDGFITIKGGHRIRNNWKCYY